MNLCLDDEHKRDLDTSFVMNLYQIPICLKKLQQKKDFICFFFELNWKGRDSFNEKSNFKDLLDIMYKKSHYDFY